MECDLCDSWEHVACVRECDRVDTQLYEALMKSRSKNILYVCLQCRKLGSIAKRICKLESNCERLTSERLASARVTDEKDELLRALRVENNRLQTRLDYVEQRLWQMTTNALVSKGKVDVPAESTADKVDRRQGVVTPTLSIVTTSSEESTDPPPSQP